MELEQVLPWDLMRERNDLLRLQLSEDSSESLMLTEGKKRKLIESHDFLSNSGMNLLLGTDLRTFAN